MFSPVEIRNPASSSTLGATSKGEVAGKESVSASKKGKKKVNSWATGIEDVVGSLGAGVPKPSALDEQDVAVESSDPSTQSKTADKEKDDVGQDDGIDDMYATEEEGGVGEETAGGGNLEGDLPLQAKQQLSQNDERGSSDESTTMMPPISMTPAVVTGLNVAQGQHQHGAPLTGSDILMAIDPALEALVPRGEPSPIAPGSGTDV